MSRFIDLVSVTRLLVATTPFLGLVIAYCSHRLPADLVLALRSTGGTYFDDQLSEAAFWNNLWDHDGSTKRGGKKPGAPVGLVDTSDGIPEVALCVSVSLPVFLTFTGYTVG
jgi:hypothetical protein